jgi:predicted transcriptional regulator
MFRRTGYHLPMDTVHHRPNAPRETEAQHERRLADERAALDEAEAQLAAGYYVDGYDVIAWLASLDTPHPLPRPEIRRR